MAGVFMPSVGFTSTSPFQVLPLLLYIVFVHEHSRECCSTARHAVAAAECPATRWSCKGHGAPAMPMSYTHCAWRRRWCAACRPRNGRLEGALMECTLRELVELGDVMGSHGALMQKRFAISAAGLPRQLGLPAGSTCCGVVFWEQVLGAEGSSVESGAGRHLRRYSPSMNVIGVAWGTASGALQLLVSAALRSLPEISMRSSGWSVGSSVPPASKAGAVPGRGGSVSMSGGRGVACSHAPAQTG
jgi:hypothetical protein